MMDYRPLTLGGTITLFKYGTHLGKSSNVWLDSISAPKEASLKKEAPPLRGGGAWGLRAAFDLGEDIRAVANQCCR
jgi:hypothetical protein